MDLKTLADRVRIVDELMAHVSSDPGEAILFDWTDGNWCLSVSQNSMPSLHPLDPEVAERLGLGEGAQWALVTEGPYKGALRGAEGNWLPAPTWEPGLYLGPNNHAMEVVVRADGYAFVRSLTLF